MIEARTVDDPMGEGFLGRYPRFAAAELDFAAVPEPLARFLAVRRWAKSLGLPRFAASVSVAEMLPRIDQTWLGDAAGNLYTSELRIAALQRMYV